MVASIEAVLALVVGQKVSISEWGKVIDEVIIRGFGSSSRGRTVIVESLSAPGLKREFAHFLGSGWKMLFEGLAGECCYNPNAPTYQLVPIENPVVSAG
jgi:hypothetical protein